MLTIERKTIPVKNVALVKLQKHRKCWIHSIQVSSNSHLYWAMTQAGKINRALSCLSFTASLLKRRSLHLCWLLNTSTIRSDCFSTVAWLNEVSPDCFVWRNIHVGITYMDRWNASCPLMKYALVCSMYNVILCNWNLIMRHWSWTNRFCVGNLYFCIGDTRCNRLCQV